MKILITGGAGFIGSHIQDKFIALGHDVTVIDNLSTGKREYVNPDATFVEGDITDFDTVKSVVSAGKFDVIDHHAAQVNVRSSFDDPVYDCHVNVIGTLNILKNMTEFSVPRIIFSSTGGAIYGSPEKIPVDESTPTNPESPYAISKQACENYIKNLADLYGIKFVILRYANVYGPRQIAQGEAGVVAIFTERLLAGKAPMIFGTGDNTRDYVFVTDVVAANVAALENGDCGIFNIGRTVETSVHEVYDAISAAFGDRAVKAEYGPAVPEVDRITLETSRAREILNWKPTIDFADGVKMTVKSFGVGG